MQIAVLIKIHVVSLVVLRGLHIPHIFWQAVNVVDHHTVILVILVEICHLGCVLLRHENVLPSIVVYVAVFIKIIVHYKCVSPG